MASTTSRSGDPASAVTHRENARASAVSDSDSTGAPQPSMPTADGVSPAMRATVPARCCCSGWSAER